MPAKQKASSCQEAGRAQHTGGIDNPLRNEFKNNLQLG
jgi:hypothetical protein